MCLCLIAFGATMIKLSKGSTYIQSKLPTIRQEEKKIRHARRPSGIGNHRVVFSYFECFFATFSPTCRNRATKPFWLRFCMQDLDLKSLIVCIQLCAEVNCMFYTYAIWGKVYPFSCYIFLHAMLLIYYRVIF